jgi:hypothetical protein
VVVLGDGFSPRQDRPPRSKPRVEDHNAPYSFGVQPQRRPLLVVEGDAVEDLTSPVLSRLAPAITASAIRR